MEHSLWSVFVVNIGINSLLSFLTLTLFIVIALKILRIKNPRLYAFCLLIPFIKLIVDINCYQFSNWALAQQMNPLNSAEGTRILSAGIWLTPFHYPLSSINFHLVQGQTFTLADLLCLQIGPHWTLICALGLLIGSIGALGRAIWQSHLSHQWLKKMRSISTLYSYSIQDPFLRSKMQRKKVAIYLTPIPHSPFITGLHHPAIFLSHSLFDKLSSQEFEAILAHEIAHLYHGDLLCNTALFWIRPLFWWIPTNYLKKQLDLTQEYACDRLLHTHLHRLHLAEALCKAANWMHTSSIPACAQPFVSSHHLVKRLQALLAQSNQRESIILKWIKSLFLMMWITTLFFGKFWTF